MVVLAFVLMLMARGQIAAQTTNTFPNSGNVGIGTTSPINALDVGTASISTFQGTAMTVSSTSGFSTVGVGQSATARGRLKWHYNATEASAFMSLSVSSGVQPLVLQDAGGNVGIGITSPAATLDITTGTGANAGINQLRLKTANPSYTTFGRLGVNYDTLYITQNAFHNGTAWVADDITKRSAQIRLGQYSNSIDFHTSSTVNTPDPPLRLRIDQNGNVGIGTSSPTSKLHVVSGTDSAMTLLSLDTGVHGGTAMTVYGTSNNESAFDMSVFRAGSYFSRFGVSNSGHVYLQPNPTASGKVGIGTTSPNFSLDVQGGQVNASGGLCIASDCKTAWSQVGGSSQWTTSGSNISYNSGSVGIGVASPQVYVALDVNTSNYKSFHTMDSTNGGLLIGYSGSTIQARETNDGNNQNLLLQNWGGNVGIGTSSPTEKLHVSGNGKFTGNLTVDGNIAAKFQDVAEWVPASEQLSAGTVVVLDSTKSNQVISSSQAYDTRVAGVISEQPGIALGESGEGKVLVATTGRVRVRVDASRAPIHIGDLLVTSDIAGVAMKSEAVNLSGILLHRPGTLIGKALEPLDKGTGTILVLLSLQ
jgi:hypothetical protein